MNSLQPIFLCIATLGLGKLLFDPHWADKLFVSKYRPTLICLGILATLGLVFRGITGAAFPILTTGAIAAVPVALVAFWSVAYRQNVALRMATFVALLALLAILLRKPITQSITTVEFFGLRMYSHDRLRISLGICSGIIAGVYCRLLGWRMQIYDAQNNRPDAATKDLWVLILGIVATVPLLFLGQYLANHYFSHLFDANFIMVRMACFYAACILAFLSLMVCRFTNQWLIAASVIITALVTQLIFRESLYQYLGFWGEEANYAWYQFTPLFILVWWGTCLLLRYLDVAFQKTGELLLFQFQIKHFVVGTTVACFLVANVKSQYQNQFAKTLKRDLQALRGDAQIRENEVVGIHIVNNGVPSLLRKSLSRLTKLESAVIAFSDFDQELITNLTQCPRLTSLELLQCRPSGTGPTIDFSGFQHLTRLSVLHSSLSTSEFAQLTSASPIRTLNLSDSEHIARISSDTLVRLDISSNQDFDPKRLLKIHAPRLQAIDFTRNNLKCFRHVPLNLPSLSELQLECPELTQDLVDELNQLELRRLELWHCKQGLERTSDLKVEDVSIFSELDAVALAKVIGESKVRRIASTVDGSVVSSLMPSIATASTSRGLVINLFDPTTSKQPLPRNTLGTRVSDVFQQLKFYSVTRVPFVGRLHIGRDSFEMSGFSIQLDQFLALTKGDGDVDIQGQVLDGDEVVLGPLSQVWKVLLWSQGLESNGCSLGKVGTGF